MLNPVFLSARNVRGNSSEEQEMVRELEIPITPQQGLLGKKKAFAKAPAWCVSCDKAVPVILPDCTLQSQVHPFELGAWPHLFEVLENLGNWHIGHGS